MAVTDKIVQSKKALIAALEQSLGIVTTACRKVDMSRDTFYRYVKEDKDFAKAVKEIENVSFDFVESQLFQLVKDKNPAAVIFYCKTKMKQRGYIERTEITGVDGSALFTLNIDDKQLPTASGNGVSAGDNGLPSEVHDN